MAVQLVEIARRLRDLTVPRGGASSTGTFWPPADVGLARSNIAPHDAMVATARGEAADLLSAVEQFRPGLARNRALALVDGALARGIEASFARCDVVGLDASGRLPLADETVDFVYGVVDAPERAPAVIAEAVRTLRLFGVAVLDLVSSSQPAAAFPAPDPRELLDASLAADQPAAPDPEQLTVTVTNTGATTLGSAVVPLRVDAVWIAGDGVRTSAATSMLDAILLPGDSIQASLTVQIPPTTAIAQLELSLVSPEPWSERRSRAAVVTWVATAVAEAGGQILGVRDLESAGGRRYFLART